MKTDELLEALHRHYRKAGSDRDGEILITEAQAPGADRRIDLIRIGLWQSRGHGIDGHELKTSRADWLRELDDPAKAEAWWPYVHRWWVVAPPEVVDPDELPAGWGLMVPPTHPRHRRFKVLVKPTEKEPKVTVPLLVELVRRTDNIRLSERDEQLYEVRREAHERIRQALDDAAGAGLTHDVRDRLDLLGKLEDRLGVTLDRFPFGDGRATPDELGDALVGVLQGTVRISRSRQQLHRLAEQMERTADRHRDEARRLLQEIRP